MLRAESREGDSDEFGIEEEVLDLSTIEELGVSAADIAEPLPFFGCAFVSIEEETHSDWHISCRVDHLADELEGDLGPSTLLCEHRGCDRHLLDAHASAPRCGELFEKKF